MQHLTAVNPRFSKRERGERTHGAAEASLGSF